MLSRRDVGIWACVWLLPVLSSLLMIQEPSQGQETTEPTPQAFTDQERWANSQEAQFYREMSETAWVDSVDAAWQAGYQAGSWEQPLEMLPWVECNYYRALAVEAYSWWPDKQDRTTTALDWVLEGLHEWSAVSNRAVVTTRMSQAVGLYPILQERAPPGMQIVGGIKTSDILLATGFEDEDGWILIAEEAKRVAELTGVAICLLENEGALKPFHQGEQKIDMRRLALSLVPLRHCGVEIWWNLPTVLGDSKAFPDRREQTARLVDVVVKVVPNSVFMLAGERMWKAKLDDPLYQSLGQQLVDIVGEDRVQQRILLRKEGQDSRRYLVEEAMLLGICGIRVDGTRGDPVVGTIVNLYPGVEAWVETGRRFGELYGD